MKTDFGKIVPKYRRKKTEILKNSALKSSELSVSAGQSSNQATRQDRLIFDRFVLDLTRGCCLAGDKELRLRPKSFEVLVYLTTHPNRLISKEELLVAVWPGVCVTEDSVVQCIKELRNVLCDPDQHLIKTIPRRGYRFEITPVPESPGLSLANRNPNRPSKSGLTVTLAILITAVLTAGFLWNQTNIANDPEVPPFSIVVLPFKNLTADPTRTFLGEGIANDIITELSRLPGLFVIAPATARKLAKDDADYSEIGRLVNVRYILEGIVHEFSDQLRINALLVNAQSGNTVWAERFDIGGDQNAHWQDELIGRIATSLNYKLTRLESDRGRRMPTDNPEAIDLATRAWALVYAAKAPENYQAARVLFRRALESEPQSIKALTGLGWTSAVMVLDGWSDDPSSDLAESGDAVNRSLTVDSNNVVAHHVRGFLLRLQHRPEEAHDAFRIATELNPNFAPGHAQLGATALELGQPTKAIDAVNRAMRLSPRDPSLGPWQAIIGRARLQLEQYDEAVIWLKRSIETGTPIHATHAYLASALALSGRLEEARTRLDGFLALRPGTTLAQIIERDRRNGEKYMTQSKPIYEGLRIAGLPE